MISQEIESLFSEINNVNEDTHYWLVRSMGGDYFNDFITKGFIAIGYNEVSLNEIKLAMNKSNNPAHELKQIIETKDISKSEGDPSDNINSQYAAAQLIKFCQDIQIGDVIVVPSRNSDYVAFARIESDVFEEQNLVSYDGECTFLKRRNIHVLSKDSRKALNPKLQLMFNSRHIVSNADNYAQYIDNCISDFYEKDGLTTIVLRVKEAGDLMASDFGVVSDLVSLVKDFSEENNLNIEVDDIKAKVCVQSPGDIMIFASNFDAICILGLLILFLTGGEISWNKEDGFKMKGGNIFKTISEFLDRKKARKISETLRKKLDNMQIETPEDLAKIMRENKDKRENY